ncbi:MAG: hypothetical protein EPGJADBJ_04417 [Saprospiraceae bacterium]|nr:hypothetical protein [Saprospiraceae bacterium]
MPLYVPPSGVAPVSANGASFRQTEKSEGQFAGVKAFTVTIFEQVEVQPLAFVIVTETVKLPTAPASTVTSCTLPGGPPAKLPLPDMLHA